MVEPSSVTLTRRQATDLLALLDVVVHALGETPMLGLVLDIEQAQALLIDKLFPDD